MPGKDYQVLDIDYAVAERCRAYTTQIKGLAVFYIASPFTILHVLSFSEAAYYAELLKLFTSLIETNLSILK
jgi:hypothetical protein